MIGGRSALLSAAGGGNPYGNWTGNYSDVSLLLRNGTLELLPLDESPSPKTITRVGDASVTTAIAKWDQGSGGSSFNFSGTSSYLRLGNQSILDVGTANFTVELWIYSFGGSNTYARAQVFGPTEGTNTSGSFAITLLGSPQGSTGLLILGNNSNIITYSTPIPAYTWTHVAVVRSGIGANQLMLFVNGNLVGVGTMTTSLATPVYDIGALNTNNPVFSDFYNGCIDDFRVTKGIARYAEGTGTNAGKMVFTGTNNLALPAAEFPANAVDDSNYHNVSLLLRRGTTGSNLVPLDESPTQKLVKRVGNTSVTTALAKWNQGTGGSSIAFDGSGDYAFVVGTSLGAATDFTFGAGDFTIEFWAWFPVVSGSGIIMDFRALGAATTNNLPNIQRVGTSLLYVVNGGPQISGGVLSANTWHHVAVARAGTNTRMFLNGAQIGSTYLDSTNYSCGANRPLMGADGNNPSVSFSQMNIDDLRITKGVARYTKNFLPPPAELPAI